MRGRNSIASALDFCSVTFSVNADGHRLEDLLTAAGRAFEPGLRLISLTNISNHTVYIDRQAIPNFGNVFQLQANDAVTIRCGVADARRIYVRAAAGAGEIVVCVQQEGDNE